MKSIVDYSHDFLKPVLHPAAVCIDATLGQGYDSQFFLAEKVRLVHAFEIQEKTADEAKNRIDNPAFILHVLSHACMKECLKGYEGKVDAVIFNFGWDPKRPGTLCTNARSSLAALKQAIELIRTKGRIALVFYPHEEGRREKEVLMDFLQAQKGLDLLCMDKPGKTGPSLCLIEKQSNWKGNTQ